ELFAVVNEAAAVLEARRAGRGVAGLHRVEQLQPARAGPLKVRQAVLRRRPGADANPSRAGRGLFGQEEPLPVGPGRVIRRGGDDDERVHNVTWSALPAGSRQQAGEPRFLPWFLLPPPKPFTLPFFCLSRRALCRVLCRKMGV